MRCPFTPLPVVHPDDRLMAPVRVGHWLDGVGTTLDSGGGNADTLENGSCRGLQGCAGPTDSLLSTWSRCSLEDAMLKTGDILYLRVPDDTNVRILHKSKIVSISDLGPTIEIDKPDPQLRTGMEVLVYYETNRRFVQQVARIERIESAEPTSLLQLALTSGAIEAEARAHSRVRWPCKGVVFTVDGEKCPVLDLSPVGFAVASQQSFAAEQIVSVSLEHEGVEYRGRAQIRSFGDVSDADLVGAGASRYGLQVDRQKEGETLPDGLRALTVSLAQG